MSLYNIWRTLKSYFGFTTNGKLTLFVEHRRSQIGLTLAPVGGCEVNHILSFSQVGDDVYVKDTLCISPRMDSRGRNNFCLCIPYDTIRQYLLPDIRSHMTQTLNSLENLQQLILYGEQSVV